MEVYWVVWVFCPIGSLSIIYWVCRLWSCCYRHLWKEAKSSVTWFINLWQLYVVRINPQWKVSQIQACQLRMLSTLNFLLPPTWKRESFEGWISPLAWHSTVGGKDVVYYCILHVFTHSIKWNPIMWCAFVLLYKYFRKEGVRGVYSGKWWK